MMKRKCLTGKRILSLLLVSTLVITCALPAACGGAGWRWDHTDL